MSGAHARLEQLAMTESDLPDKRRRPTSYPLSTMDLRSGDELTRSSSSVNQHTSRENLESCLEKCCKNNRFSNFVMFTDLVNLRWRGLLPSMMGPTSGASDDETENGSGNSRQGNAMFCTGTLRTHERPMPLNCVHVIIAKNIC